MLVDIPPFSLCLCLSVSLSVSVFFLQHFITFWHHKMFYINLSFTYSSLEASTSPRNPGSFILLAREFILPSYSSVTVLPRHHFSQYPQKSTLLFSSKKNKLEVKLTWVHDIIIVTWP
jgi:hypothetical protein